MSAKDDYDQLSELAERLELDDDERESFVGSAMKRLGHAMKTMWEDATDNGKGSGGGDFFSQKRQTRNVGNKDRRGGGGFGMSGYGG